MPSITLERREELSKKMSEILNEACNDTLTTSELHYVMANILDAASLSSTKKTDNLNYSTCNSIIGLLESLKLDFYNKLTKIGDFYKNDSQESRFFILKNAVASVTEEIDTSKLIYSHHGCDSWEDMFRDNIPELEEKVRGIAIAINEFLSSNKLY